IDSTPYVKIEIIEALGKIGSEQAKTSLLSIFNTYWKQGPKSEKYVWEDSDYSSVVRATLEALYSWKSEKEIFDMFRSIYLEERKIPDWRTQEKAYELFLRAKMEREGIIGPEKEINYLLSNLKSSGLDWVKGKNGVKTIEAIQDGAVATVLIKYSKVALPYIDKELNKISSTQEKRRYEALSCVKKHIEKTLEHNCKEQEKENSKTEK
ncbi:MAG: HEAT repeat domain-containing protein, partial [Sedimentisphaerales bacterium]